MSIFLAFIHCIITYYGHKRHRRELEGNVEPVQDVALE